MDGPPTLDGRHGENGVMHLHIHVHQGVAALALGSTFVPVAYCRGIWKDRKRAVDHCPAVCQSESPAKGRACGSSCGVDVSEKQRAIRETRKTHQILMHKAPMHTWQEPRARPRSIDTPSFWIRLQAATACVLDVWCHPSLPAARPILVAWRPWRLTPRAMRTRGVLNGTAEGNHECTRMQVSVIGTPECDAGNVTRVSNVCAVTQRLLRRGIR